MGCQNYIFRSFDLDSNDSLSVDAKQRLVFVTQRGGRHGNRQIVCAEPSPDALSATAAAASAAFALPTAGGAGAGGPAQGGLSAGRSESAASIGLRTQSIQLLRDGLYRACEAYMNGAIDETQYTLLLLNIDRLMVTLVGVDAIGGTPIAPPVVVSASAPVTKSTVSKDGVVTTEVTSPGTASGGQAFAVNARAAHLEAASANAIRDIVTAANAGTSFPAVCLALLSSNRLDYRNPAERSVIESCNFMMRGAFSRILSQPPPAARRQPTGGSATENGTDAPKAVQLEVPQGAPSQKAQTSAPQQPASWNPTTYPQGSLY
jgi:hypothetical protein